MADRNSIYEWMHQYIMECLNSEHSMYEGWAGWKRLRSEMEQIRHILWEASDNGIEEEMILEVDTRLERMMPPSDARDVGRAVCLLIRKKEEINKVYDERKYEHELLKHCSELTNEPTNEQADDSEIPWDEDQDDSDQDAFMEEAAREIRMAYETTARQLRDGHLRKLREEMHRLTDEAREADVGYGPTEAWNAAVEGFYPRAYTYCQGIDPLAAEEFLRNALEDLRDARITGRGTCLQAAARLRNLAGRLFDLLYILASVR